MSHCICNHLEYAVGTENPRDSVGTNYQVHQGTLSDLNWIYFDGSSDRKPLRVFDVNCKLNQAYSRYKVELCLAEQELLVGLDCVARIEV